MIRVLFVISSIEARAGGPTSELIGHAAAQAAAGQAVHVVVTWRNAVPEESVRRLRDAGATVTLIGPARTPLAWTPNMGAVLHPLIRAADVVHIKGMWEEIQYRAAVLCRAENTPYVWTAHGMLSPWSLAQSPLRKKLFLALRLRRVLNRASLLHFTTTMERDLAAHLKLHPAHVVEPPGVGFDEFDDPEPPETFRRQHPILTGKKIIAFLGRIHPGKGVERLIDAMPEIPPSAMLVVIGPDSAGHLATVQRQIAERGVADRVLFTGALAGKAKVAALRDAEVFALPSDHENFGISAIEAMAAGLPAVLSDQVGAAEMLQPSGVVSIVPLQTPPLVDALRQWLETDRPRHQIASAASSFSRQTFAWDRIARRWAGHYSRLCGTKP